MAQRLGLILAGALCAATLVAAGCGGSMSPSTPNQTPTTQNQESQDASARSLVRLGMMVIETAYVDLETFDLVAVTPAVLQAIEPTVTFTVAESLESAATSPTHKASENQLDYYSEADNTYAVGTISESGSAVGVIVRNAPAGETTEVTFYLDGKPVDW